MGEVWEPGWVKCGRQGACSLLTEWATRCKGGQGADLGKGHFCARPIILRALLRVILHFEGTMEKITYLQVPKKKTIQL